MKRFICLLIGVITCVGIMLTGCAQSDGKAPDEYKNVRWIAPDYSFSIYPGEDCTGKYVFNDTTYEIKAEFDSDKVTVYDKGNKDAELFNALWRYEDSGLYVYDMMYNTETYKELEDCYSEFIFLNKEKLDK